MTATSHALDDRLRHEGAALADRFGEETALAFADALPALVADLAARWSLTPEHLYSSGASSVVLGVATGDGRAAVLKLSPDAGFLHRQAAMLRYLAPTGRVPEVIASSPDQGALLLERVVPGDTLDSARSVPPTPAQWAGLLRDLHRPLHGTGDQAQSDAVEGTLKERCDEMVDRVGARRLRPQVREHVTDDLWESAVASCHDLLATGDDQTVIHGDLHLGNVLDGGERGLVVIDPKLCVGDRCFDMVDFVLVDDDPAAWVARARALAPLVGLDGSTGADRLIRWSRVNAVVTAVSHLATSGPDARTAGLLAFAGGTSP